VSSGFRVEIPGQPPSWNACYRIVNVRGHATLKKTSEAETYQTDVTRLTRTARPSDFSPKGRIYIAYQMFLRRSMDADNVIKLVNDALAVALDIDDARFLPIVLQKTTGNHDPRLVIGVLDADVYAVEVSGAGDRWVGRALAHP